VQPPVIRLLTARKERRIRMAYQKGNVSQLTKILFPVVVTVIAGMVAPASVALVGFLMFGNLLRECGVLNALSETAQLREVEILSPSRLRNSFAGTLSGN
ncbi:MAG: sodium ion-translocating decarboxylase subunit beta, partial [Muribaculaceae bacterium]|nr:sodium ion-translocating decarboxylase subunit beta [Muribaculaceae bacterium]